MIDLMLVNPLFLRDDPVESRLMTPYFPLGILYLAATARQAGYSVSIFDGMFANGDSDFVAALKRDRPRVVGISALATVRTTALRLAELAHEHGALVIMGGADPTGRPEHYLRHTRGDTRIVDLVVVGEAEQTLEQLMPVLLSGDYSMDAGGKDYRSIIESCRTIEGLAYRDESGEIVRTAPRPHCVDLDRLPVPARDLIDIDSYRRAWRKRHGMFSLSIIATRGCPFHCTWCQKSVFGDGYRPRSPEAVAEEMAQIKGDFQPDHIRIVDDVMGIDHKWMLRWRDALLAHDAITPFECLSRVDLVDEAMVHLLRESGCRRIAFGAESGSQKVLDAMRKGTRVEQIHRAAALCKRYGIETYFYIMLGYPGEEWEDILDTVALLRDTRPDRFSSTIAYPLPGTDFYQEVEGELTGAPDWDYTAENRLLFRRNHSTRFYRWVQRWLFHEWQAARLQHREDTIPLHRRIRNRIALWIVRGGVQILRRWPAEEQEIQS